MKQELSKVNMGFIGQTKIGEHKLYWGDCLEVMPRIPDKSIDMIFADLPYGTTACKWDIIIPFDSLWVQYERIIKDNGAMIFTASQPFTSALVMSNPNLFRYEWIWEKDNHTNFLQIKNQPGKRHENVLVFYKHQPIYNPQFWIGEKSHKIGSKLRQNIKREYLGNGFNDVPVKQTKKKYPISIVKFKGMGRGKAIHPTQKPIKLLEYLIETYTNENDIVLDNVMGSGTTGEACVNLNRRFIGIEKEEKYFRIAYKRLKDIYTGA